MKKTIINLYQIFPVFDKYRKLRNSVPFFYIFSLFFPYLKKNANKFWRTLGTIPQYFRLTSQGNGATRVLGDSDLRQNSALPDIRCHGARTEDRSRSPSYPFSPHFIKGLRQDPKRNSKGRCKGADRAPASCYSKGSGGGVYSAKSTNFPKRGR